MNAAGRGNDPSRWGQLLTVLDERLQLGLLDHLRRVGSYHFEDDVLFIEPSSPDQERYLSKPTVIQQLEIFADDACKVKKVRIKSPQP